MDPEMVPDLSAPEWALIHFLRDVRARVVEPLLGQWKGRLLAEGAGSDAFNVVSGLLNLPRRAGEPPPRAELSFSERLGQPAISEAEGWVGYLERHGHRLFNSFFYFPIEALGQSMLVPLVLGGRDGSTFARMGAFTAQEGLPYEVEESQRFSFASQLLPCNAGVSPLFYYLVRRQWSKVAHLYEGIPVQVAPRWLGKLNLLHKQEDYQLRSLSAMVSGLCDVGREADAAGIYVLTCAIPHAFDSKGPGHGLEARKALHSVVQEHCRHGMLGSRAIREGIQGTLGAGDPWTWYAGGGGSGWAPRPETLRRTS